MIQSMTAFARKDLQSDWGSISWEIRNVNNRYLELHLRLPEELRSIDSKAREIVRDHLSRGKVECTARVTATSQGKDLQLNEARVQQLAQVTRTLTHLIDNPDRINPIDILNWPGVLTPPTIDSEQVQHQALELFQETITALVAAREREGSRLQELIQQRCEAMRPLVEQARAAMPRVIEQSREKMRERLKEFLDQLDENRLEQEVALLAQRLDIDEEMDRLTSHLDEVERVLVKGGTVGRRLDFLMQELHREANTLGSKSSHLETTRISVEMKVLIEQMREQVQNIE